MLCNSNNTIHHTGILWYLSYLAVGTMLPSPVKNHLQTSHNNICHVTSLPKGSDGLYIHLPRSFQCLMRILSILSVIWCWLSMVPIWYLLANFTQKAQYIFSSSSFSALVPYVIFNEAWWVEHGSCWYIYLYNNPTARRVLVLIVLVGKVLDVSQTCPKQFYFGRK